MSPACDHCYARELAKRFGWGWGADARRRFFGEKHWQEPHRWNRQAAAAGRRHRVFCASMADVFEILPAGHPDEHSLAGVRERLWATIEATPLLDWQLLTKRPKNIQRLVPARWWAGGFPSHVWVGCTVENQEWAEKRVRHILPVPARVRFLSIEPLLGPVDLMNIRHGQGFLNCLTGDYHTKDEVLAAAPGAIDWVILGGESGGQAREYNLDWARDILQQCRLTRTAAFHKQLGRRPMQPPAHGGATGYFLQLDDTHGGNADEWPEDLKTRQFPEAA